MATSSKSQQGGAKGASSGSKSSAGKSSSSSKSGGASSRSASSGSKTAGTRSAAGAKSSASRSSAKQSKQMQPGAMLEKWFHDQLKDVYYAEKALTKAMPKMRKQATTPQLQAALEEHLRVTEGQIKRLERAFEILGKRPSSKKCDGMEGLLKEGEHSMDETKDDTYTRDVALIMSAQKVEHYEICAYGTLAEVARTMGQEEIARLMDETLQEEKEADRILTMIAENDINLQADREGEKGAKQGGGQGGQRQQGGSMGMGQQGGQRSGSR